MKLYRDFFFNRNGIIPYIWFSNCFFVQCCEGLGEIKLNSKAQLDIILKPLHHFQGYINDYAIPVALILEEVSLCLSQIRKHLGKGRIDNPSPHFIRFSLVDLL